MKCWHLCLKYGKPWTALSEKEKTGKSRQPRTRPVEMAVSTDKVLAALRPGRLMVHSEIVESTGLCSRTVRHAIKRLKSRGLITEKFNWRDGRKWLYQIKEQPQEGAQQEATA